MVSSNFGWDTERPEFFFLFLFSSVPQPKRQDGASN